MFQLNCQHQTADSVLLKLTAIKESYNAYAYQMYRLWLKFTVFNLKRYNMFIIIFYKIIVVFIVYNCLPASWFLVLQTSVVL